MRVYCVVVTQHHSTAGAPRPRTRPLKHPNICAHGRKHPPVAPEKLGEVGDPLLDNRLDVDETFISFAARAPTIYLLLGAATATRLWSGRPCSGPCPAAAARLAAGTPPGDTAATAAKSLRAVGPRARAPPSRSTAWVFAHHHRRTSRRRTRLPVVTFLRVVVRVFGAGGAREAAPRGFLLA